MSKSVAFSIFNFEIYWYGIFYATSFLLIYIFSNFINLKHKIVKNFDQAYLYSVISMFLGARLGNFLLYDGNFDQILNYREGGLSFHGGVIGLLIAIYLYSVLYKEDFWKTLDLSALFSPISLFFGRWGNFLNGELLGKITNFLNLGRHPVAIYELFFEGFILQVIMLIYFNKYQFQNSGNTVAVFCFFYSIFRIILEIFRVPDGEIWLFSKGQFYCIPMFIFALLIFYKNRKI